MPSVPACCSEYGKARGSKGLASYFTCDRATYVGRCTFASHVGCCMSHAHPAAAPINSPGMPSNSRRHSRLFAVTAPRFGFSGTVFAALIRAQPSRAAAALGADLGAFARERLAEATLTAAAITAAHSHRHTPPPSPLGAPVGSSSTAPLAMGKLPKSEPSERFRKRKLPDPDTSEIGRF